MFSDRKHRHLLPTWQDLEVLEAVKDVLEPFATLTDLLSGDTIPTISSVIPTIRYIKTLCEQAEDPQSELAKSMRKVIITYVQDK